MRGWLGAPLWYTWSSLKNAPARPVEFRYADPPKAGFNRASAFPVACCGVSERTAIKWIHSLHFEDSLQLAAGSFNSHECESILVVPLKISWEFRRKCASKVIVNFLMPKIIGPIIRNAGEDCNRKVKGRAARLRRMALYEGNVQVGTDWSIMH
jgi:hypothetical protein